MKKVVKGTLICIGILLVIGAIGSMELDLISLCEAVGKILNGSLIAAVGWLSGEVWEAVLLVKNSKRQVGCTEKILNGKMSEAS